MENILDELYNIVLDRKTNPKKDSYVCSLLNDPDKLLKKVGEEATETILSAKNNNKAELIYEIADLWFHTIILLGLFDTPPQKIYEELKNRRK